MGVKRSKGQRCVSLGVPAPGARFRKCTVPLRRTFGTVHRTFGDLATPHRWWYRSAACLVSNFLGHVVWHLHDCDSQQFSTFMTFSSVEHDSYKYYEFYFARKRGLSGSIWRYPVRISYVT